MKALDSQAIRIGAWRVDSALDEISRDGTTVKLEHRLMQLLLYLAEREGQVVSVEELLDRVWAGVVVTQGSVYNAVASLRRLLGDDTKEPTYIANVPRRGYRLVAPVAPWVETQKPATAQHPATAAPMAVSDKSIAVLPFADMSAEKNQEYFADGLAEALIDLLTQVQDLRVPARTSSFYFNGKAEDIAMVAPKLRVAHVLEGSVRKAGNTVRITAHLIRAENGYHLWSKTYDRDIEDIFKVQDEIAGVVVEALKVHLLPTQGVVNRHRTTVTEAYEHYLLARHIYGRAGTGDYLRGIAALRQAIAIDPSYAAAHALLAVYGVRLSEQGSYRVLTEAEIIAAAERAVSLAPDLAMSNAARGFVRIWVQWDFSGAQADLEQAIRLNPRDAGSHLGYSLLLCTLARAPEALTAAQTAIELEPLNVDGWVLLGVALAATGQDAEGRRALARALELSPDAYVARAFLDFVLLKLGDTEEALRTNREQPVDHWRLQILAMAEYSLGHRAASDDALSDLIARCGRDEPGAVADVYAWRGEKDKAFEWLERAYRQQHYWLTTLHYVPQFAGLRGDPRLKALLRKMNLPVRDDVAD